MSASLLYLDGVDAADLGILLTGVPDTWSTPDIGCPLVSVPGKDGARFGRGSSTRGVRGITVNALINEDGNFATSTGLVDGIKDAVLDRMVQIRTFAAPNLAFYGVCTEPRFQVRSPDQGARGTLLATMRFICPDPYAVDIDPTVVSGVADEAVSVPQGTGITYGNIWVVGAATTPTITGQRHDGRTFASVPFSGNLTASDAYLLDTTDGGTFWLVDDGVVSRAESLVSHPFTIPVFTPRYAVRALGSYAWLATSSGRLVMECWRRWA